MFPQLRLLPQLDLRMPLSAVVSESASPQFWGVFWTSTVCLWKAEVHSSHRLCSGKLGVFGLIFFLMHVRFFFLVKAPLTSEHLIWLDFFKSCHKQNIPGVRLSYQLTKKKRISASVFVPQTENGISCFLQVFCYHSLLLCIECTAVVESLDVFRYICGKPA